MIKFDPARSQHEVDVALQLVTPEFDYATQVELADDVMGLNQCVHVSFQTMLGVHTFLIKFNLDEAVWIGADDEINLGPVYHDDLLDIVNNIRQLLGSESLQTSILLSRSKVAIKDFLLMEPLCSIELFLSCLVWVVMYKVWHDIVALFFLVQEAIMILPCVLVHTRIEGTFADFLLLALLLFASILLMLEEYGVLIWQPLVVTE